MQSLTAQNPFCAIHIIAQNPFFPCKYDTDSDHTLNSVFGYMYVDMSFGFYCSVHFNSNSDRFTSFGPGLTLLSVLGKMLRLVEDDADFSRFFHKNSWYLIWYLVIQWYIRLGKIIFFYALISQIWWALLTSSQNPSRPSGECSRNVWGAFCDGSDEEEKCDFQSWPKAPRAMNDCRDSMTNKTCKIYFKCVWSPELAAKYNRLSLSICDNVTT